MSHGEARPPRPIQHPMIILKMPLLAQSHHPQHRSHCALAGRQQRPDHQYLHMLPYTLGKDRGELYNHSRQGDRDGKHSLPLLAQGWEAAYRPVALLLKSSTMDKVELRDRFKTEHAAPSQPESRGHRRQIVRAVFIHSTVKDD